MVEKKEIVVQKIENGIVIDHIPLAASYKIIKILEINRCAIGKSQFYRYINTLQSYNLVIISNWVKNNKGSGYRYKITPMGSQILNDLSLYFE